MKGRLTLELDFDTGAYTMEVKNLDEPGKVLPLAPLKQAFELAIGSILGEAAAKAGRPPAPQPMELEDSVTSGKIRLD